LIQESMATLLADRTTFVIAHRLSRIRRADLIRLLDDGRPGGFRGSARASTRD
jgi:ABC-type multidrug transport system fused ATPase/permease subunit